MLLLPRRYAEARQVLQAAGPAALKAADAAGRTPLALACMGGHGRLVKLLVRQGAGLDVAAHDGATPLMLALAAGHRGIAAHLLAAGADAGACDGAGCSAADRLLGEVPQAL